MKSAIYILLSCTVSLKVFSQTVYINSISTSRQSNGDNGYTLDGLRMTAGSRPKLLNPNNFSLTGIYPKNVLIFDGYSTSGSLNTVSNIPLNNIFFFGSFNKNDISTQPFTLDEIDSLYNWSLRGGKLIIASGGSYSTFFDANILNSKWGYSYQSQNPCSFIPTSYGTGTDIFNGPFGNVIAANQGAAAQGYFNSVTTNSKILATDANGNATLFMDCNTLDLIISDVDGYTDLGGITSGATIINAQDKFWTNTIVFMDNLQPLPVITKVSNTLTLNSTYISYQWYLNNTPVIYNGNQSYNASENGNYYVEVTVNGGCTVRSNILTIDSIETDLVELPNIFSPNGDGINDTFIPTRLAGIKINQIFIFNRWGKLVYNKTNPITLWDGKINNNDSTEGVYYWILEYQDSMETMGKKTGFVQLIR
ncbi:MAG: gliding motility-associated C-terminal domain-containing protein [Bacteroidia bacterium]|jgi:gliding motility-associated-like protein